MPSAASPIRADVYRGATIASFVEGKGITCDNPPAGCVQEGLAAASLHVPGAVNPYGSSPSRKASTRQEITCSASGTIPRMVRRSASSVLRFGSSVPSRPAA